MATSTIVPSEFAPPFPEERWNEAADYVCHVSVELKVPSFTVSDFLRLKKGAIVSSNLGVSSDVPFLVNGQQIAWATWVSANVRLAARIREIA
jgi:flagellar motor switch/type III secretory pathway protein FliN